MESGYTWREYTSIEAQFLDCFIDIEHQRISCDWCEWTSLTTMIWQESSRILSKERLDPPNDVSPEYPLYQD